MRLRLFGGPILGPADGEPVSLSPLQAALVGLLGEAGPEGATRSRLIHLLWQQNPDARTRHRLSQLLYALSEKVDPLEPIDADVERVRLDPARVESDLDAVRGPDGGTPDALPSVTAGAFLSSLPRPPTRAYEEWLRRTRAGLRSEIRERAVRAWSESAEKARWRAAARAAATLLELDPGSEDALRRLMRARGMSGQVQEALASYEGFRERQSVRDPEDSWTPAPATRTLVERLREVAETPQPPPEVGGAPPPPDPPFCGRREELARLSRVVADRERAEVVTVFVTGEGGIGKTRLVAEALREARLRDYLVLRGDTTRFEHDIPLNLLLDALDREEVGDALNGLRDPWRSVLLSLMPNFHREEGPLPEVPTIQPGNIPRRMYQAVHRLVEALSERSGPLLLFLDDFQWADETSVAALEFFRRRWSGGRLVLVLGLRRERLGRPSPVLEFAEEVLAENDTLHLPLEELGPESARELVQEAADRPLAPEVQGRICALGGMNPFFLVELTHEYLHGRLEVGPPEQSGSVPVPLSIRQVLEHRFAELTDEDVHLLEVLAVHEQPLAWSILPEIAERSAGLCAECIERLQAVRLARWHDHGLTVRHELIRHAVYGRMSKARRVLLHERIARGLLRSDGAEHPDELALHFDRAGIADEALRFSLQAADRAETSGAVPEAIHFLTTARRNTDDPETAAVIVGRLGHLNYLHRNLQDAAPLLDLAATRFRELGHIDRALTAEVERIDALSRMESLPLEDFLQELVRIKTEAESQEQWETLARALDVEAHTLDRRGDVEGVRRVLREVEGMADRGSAVARCVARTVLALKLFYGSHEESLKSAREAVSEGKRAGNEGHLLRACSRLIIVLLHQGLLQTPEGKRTIQLADSLATSSADRFLRFNQPLNQGVWHLDVGEYERAEDFFKQARKIAEEHPSDELDRNLLLNVAELRLHEGKVEEAHKHFRTLSEDQFRGTPVYVPDIARAGLGLCELYQGRLHAAVQKETLLAKEPEWWTFDRYLIVLLRAKILQYKKSPQMAADFLAENASEVEQRFVLCGIRLRMDEAKVRSKVDPKAAKNVLSKLSDVTSQFSLSVRQTQVQRLIERIDRRDRRKS